MYDVFLHLLFILYFPKALWDFIFKGKYRKSFPFRLGWGIRSIPKDRCVVWLHAASVGEVKALVAIAGRIKSTFPECFLLITTVTETGQQEAISSIPKADAITYLPLDFKWLMKRAIRAAHPEVVILIESEFWWNFLQSAKEEGAKIAVINAKLSTKSLRRMTLFPTFSKKLLGLIDLILTQNEEYKQRFIQAGALPSFIESTGNLKFDLLPEPLPFDEVLRIRKSLFLSDKHLAIVVGSTHYPEESEILTRLRPVLDSYPDIKLLMVPRHPERFEQVAKLINKTNLTYCRLSRGVDDPESRIILIDVMGKLAQCYQIAEMAIVGGSFFKKFEGHNILEPACLGVPTLFGPYMSAQKEMVDLAKQYRCAIQTPLSQLQTTVQRLLYSPDELHIMSENGLELSAQITGSTDRTWHYLQKLFLF